MRKPRQAPRLSFGLENEAPSATPATLLAALALLGATLAAAFLGTFLTAALFRLFLAALFLAAFLRSLLGAAFFLAALLCGLLRDGFFGAALATAATTALAGRARFRGCRCCRRGDTATGGSSTTGLFFFLFFLFVIFFYVFTVRGGLTVFIRLIVASVEDLVICEHSLLLEIIASTLPAFPPQKQGPDQGLLRASTANRRAIIAQRFLCQGESAARFSELRE